MPTTRRAERACTARRGRIVTPAEDASGGLRVAAPAAGSAAVPLLRFQDICKRFGGTQACDHVTLDVAAGRIMALLGENGAGKSTLIKILAGVYRPDSGRILWKGEPVQRRKGLPIRFIHQDLGLIEWMTVAENLALGAGYGRRATGLIGWRSTEERASALLEVVGGNIDPRLRMFSLTRTEKSLVAIARALAVDCELLVLDEPTASLPAADVDRLFAVLERLKARGIGMIYVSHRLDEVFRLADTVAVMRDGRLVGHRAVKETTPRQLVEMIVGRPPTEVFRKPPPPRPAPVLALEEVRLEGVGPISLTLAAGELLGLAGLRGAGHEQLGRALFGQEPILSGRVLINGRAVTPNSPLQAIAAGITLVPANRQEESLATGMSVRENLFVNPALHGRRLAGLLSRRREGREALRLVRKFNVRPPEPEREIETLSGGNQQKVVLARWLEVGNPVIVLEEPTQGVDVGAKAEIYALLGRILEDGAAVLMISSDLEEIANVCARALVFNRGRIVAELSGDDLTMSNLIHDASMGEEAA
jgi:ribose transport system ATP-binding protein